LFGDIVYKNELGSDATILDVPALLAAVIVGLIQNAFGKGGKILDVQFNYADDIYPIGSAGAKN
jgi:hypothetical protein